jgi:hypothetical protein
VSMALGVLFEFGLAAWGLSTATGLLRLKAWSRISTLIFGGLLAVTSAISALIFMVVPLPATAGTPENFNFFFRVGMGSFCAVLLAIAAWWLVLFTRKSVVAQFADPALFPEVAGGMNYNIPSAPSIVTPQPRRPLSITIIAWLFVVSVPTTIPALLMVRTQKTPVPFFWTILVGRGTWIYFAFHVLLMFAAGIALLRNKTWGLWLAIGIQAFSLINFVMIALLPGRAVRWEKFMEYYRHSFPPDMLAQSSGFLVTLMWLMFAFGTLIPLTYLWFLWTRKKRFLEFAAEQARSRSTAS